MANIYVNDIIKRAQDQEHGYVVDAKNVTGIKAYAWDPNTKIQFDDINSIKSYIKDENNNLIPFNEVTGIQSYIENYIKNNVIIKINGSTGLVSVTGINNITFNLTIDE